MFKILQNRKRKKKLKFSLTQAHKSAKESNQEGSLPLPTCTTNECACDKLTVTISSAAAAAFTASNGGGEA